MNKEDLKKYPFIIRRLPNDKLRYTIKFPDFVDCRAKGRNISEAVKKGYLTLKKSISLLESKKLPIPKPYSKAELSKIKKSKSSALYLYPHVYEELLTNARADKVSENELGNYFVEESLKRNKLNLANKAKEIFNKEANESNPFINFIFNASMILSSIISFSACIYTIYYSLTTGTGIILSLLFGIAAFLASITILLIYSICLLLFPAMILSAKEVLSDDGFEKIVFVDRITPIVTIFSQIVSFVVLFYNLYSGYVSNSENIAIMIGGAFISSLITGILTFALLATFFCITDYFYEELRIFLQRYFRNSLSRP